MSIHIIGDNLHLYCFHFSGHEVDHLGIHLVIRCRCSQFVGCQFFVGKVLLSLCVGALFIL